MTGKLGILCNTIAFIFLAVVLGKQEQVGSATRVTDRPSTGMMFFPTSPNPRPADMNWSVVMYGCVTIVLLVYYFRSAKYSYHGPVTAVSHQWTIASAERVESAARDGARRRTVSKLPFIRSAT